MQGQSPETKHHTEDQIVGQVQAVYFESPNNFYKVLRLEVDQDQTSLLVDDEIVVTGQFASIHLDTPYQFFGKIVTHPKYGEQFAVSHYQQVLPSSRKGLVDYLSSDRFKGIGPKLANNIVDCLGEEALTQIAQDPKALDAVPGLSAKKAEQLRTQVLKYQGTERIFMQLHDWGISPNLAQKIYQRFKADSLDLIKANPYVLVEEVEGVGFARADQIGQELGIEPDAKDRVLAAILLAIGKVCFEAGDTYTSQAQALTMARKILEDARPFIIEDQVLIRAMQAGIQEEKILLVGQSLVLPSIFYAESGVARSIKNYLADNLVETYSNEEIDEAIEDVVALLDIPYDENQRRALKLAMKSPMSIITGGPGTGKTTLVQGVIYLHAILHGYDLKDMREDNFDLPIKLAAPTGRAAKRMQQSAQIPASTIHRMIGYTRDSNLKDFQPQILDGSLLIVDEMSMVDVWLMNWLMQAIPYEMQVVFVGDQDQLPSVGPGKVFADLIASGTIPTIFLKRIYRQAQDSSIIHLAHAIRQGQLPANLMDKQKDRSFIPCQGQQVGEVVRQVVAAALKKGFDAYNFQVLAPTYKGTAGIDNLNLILQELMNPATHKKREIQHFDRVFRVGDKVLQLVNNTEEGVYNGDIGRIVAIMTAKETESKAEEVVVSFEGVEVKYKRSEMDQLTLAYACSIHKAQGSEYDLVLLPLVDPYSRMLRRDILYTGITRASKSLVLMGNPYCFEKAVTQEQEARATQLVDLLQLLTKDQDKSLVAARSEMCEASDLPSRQETATSQKTADSTPATHEPPTSDYHLTPDNIWQIDPMIGMEGISPYDFLPESMK